VWQAHHATLIFWRRNMQIGRRLLPKVHTFQFRGTESEISLDAINVCAIERRDSSDSFRT